MTVVAHIEACPYCGYPLTLLIEPTAMHDAGIAMALDDVLDGFARLLSSE